MTPSITTGINPFGKHTAQAHTATGSMISEGFGEDIHEALNDLKRNIGMEVQMIPSEYRGQYFDALDEIDTLERDIANGYYP